MKAFQCSHSGLLYPEDYIKEWGTKYGRGMGPVAGRVADCYCVRSQRCRRERRIVVHLHPGAHVRRGKQAGGWRKLDELLGPDRGEGRRWTWGRRRRRAGKRDG